jgi:hypothetical protein
MRVGAPGAMIGAVAWAAGAWLALGTVGLPPAGTGARLGILPPIWLFMLLGGAAVAIARTLRLDGRRGASFFLALLAGLPWMPGAVPASFMILAGPFALVPVIAGLLGVLPWDRWRWATPSVARHQLAAAGTGLALASVIAAWHLAPVLPGGDEPHYLIITESLLHDGDLRIENNHAARQYLAFADSELKPDYLRRGRDGAIYSIHAPGLATLVLPAFAMGGYPAVVLFLAIACALVSLLAWRAAHAVTGDARAAWVGWLSVAATVPFFFQTFTVYPDGPAALIVLFVVWALAVADGRSPGRLAPIGLALAALPWLHTRYAFLSMAAGLVVAGRLVWPTGSRPPLGAAAKRLAVFLVIPAISGALWLWFFQAIYGRLDPRAPYGGATDVHLARIPHGLAGLLLDQQFGLLPNAPIYLIALAGLATLWRHHRRLAVELAVLSTPYVLAVAAFHMWWAGHSSPARFLVPVLLPMAIPIAAWWRRHDSTVPRLAAAVLLTVSIALTIALAGLEHGALAYNSRDGFAAWLDLATPSVNLARALPSLFQTGVGGAISLTLVWAGAWTAAWFLLRFSSRRVASRGPWALLAGTVLTAAALAGASLAWTVSGAQPLEPGSSAVALATRACKGGGVGLAAGKAEPIGIRAVSAGLVIPVAWRRPLPSPGPLWAGRDLPPGEYAVRLESGVQVTGMVSVALGRPDQRLQQCQLDDARPGRTACRIDLPAGASDLWLLGDAEVQRSAPTLTLEAISLGPATDCGLHAGRAITSAGGALFVTGGRVFAEGSGAWVEGGREGRFVGRPDGHELRIRLRTGETANHVRVVSGGWHDDVALQPGEARDVAIPARDDGAAIEVTIAPRTGFRPADVDRASHDVRWLGVWVQPG